MGEWNTIDEYLTGYRTEIESLAQQVKSLKGHPVFDPNAESDGVADTGEMIANIMLAYRHLEDARMRLGKVIQAKDGGVSVYNK